MQKIQAIENIAKMTSGLARSLFFNSEFEVSSPPTREVDRVIFGQKISNILLGGRDLRLIIKIHYSDTQGELLLKKYAYAKEISQKKVDDYFMECCNLLAGRLKQSLADRNISVGISLPIKTKGFDDLFFGFADHGFCSEWHWDLSSKNGESIHMSVFVEILSDATLDIPEFEEKKEDEVEFF